ncbi:MAG TPA: hypothetical protein VFG79_11470 [Solirubrobacter sp.]|nr:hypothetical protein [Solirubrobacter sp.]
MPSVERPQRRANVLEIVGAWLRIWVPPRDAYVPPVPWKKLAIGTGIGVVLLGIALAIMIPRINRNNAEFARDIAATKAANAARNRERIKREQAPHPGQAVALRPPAGASADQVDAARASLLDRVGTDIVAYVKRRAANGDMKPLLEPPACEHTSGTPTSGPIGVFDCFGATTRIPTTDRNAGGTLGYPFRAVLDYDKFSYTWCRIEKVPGEKLVLDPRNVTLLPPACRLPAG